MISCYGHVLIYSTNTDTQLTDLCFPQFGLLLPLWDFQQSCMHTPCWVYVATGQHLLAKTTPDMVIKLLHCELNRGCLHHVSPCYQLCYHEQLNSTSVYKTYKWTTKNMESQLWINSGMSTTILARVHYHTAKHEWNWMASINQHASCHDGVLVDS
jgi:hypothetical protein